MIGKWIGAFCIFVSCASVGFTVAYRQTRELKMIEQWIRIIARAEKEICCHLRAVPDLFRMISYEENGPLGRLFLRTAIEMENQIQPNASICLNVALADFDGLPKSVLDMLILFGAELGRYDLESQLKGLAEIRAIAEEKRTQILQNHSKRIRGYQTLGLCAGAALVILFI